MLRPLVAVSAAGSGLVLGAGLAGGSLLMRDAVSTPRSFLTDAALGLGGSPARAVPQDGLLAIISTVLPGTAVVIAVTWTALVLSGIGAGVLASRIVDGGWAPQCAAALAVIWNPWIAERMMQGHWSLIVGYAAVPWILVAAERIWRSDRGGWPLLWVAAVGAGLTPTGSVLAAIAVAAAVVVPLVRARRWRHCVTAVLAVVIGALPWLVATMAGSAGPTSDPGGAQVFALRAEPGLGRVFTALGMGGIWNVDAVPASRTTWWAAVATALFLAVVVAGWYDLVRRGGMSPSARRLLLVSAVLALGTVTLVVLASTTPGLAALGLLLEHVPGAGLFRDTQKFLALLGPAAAIGAAGSVRHLSRLVPAGFAGVAVAVLIVAPLPDAALRLHPVDLPSDWRAVARLIPADHGAVALWPTGMAREYSFTRTASLDPARRMLRAPVLESGALQVDGATVDADPANPAAQVERALLAGAGPAQLRGHGVGWLLVEEPERNGVPAGFASAAPVFRGDYLVLYRVEDPSVAPGASAARRAVVLAAHLVWVLALAAAVAATLLAVSGRRTGRSSRRTPR